MKKKTDTSQRNAGARSSRARGSALFPDEWVTLEHLGSLPRGMLSPIGRDNFETLLNRTRGEDEHPENYDGPCECRLCMSYADEPNGADRPREEQG